MTSDDLRNDGAADDGVWNQAVADGYDDDPAMFDPGLLEKTVDLLAGYARGGRACEFAIGTGRVALPLRARGVEVAGIDNSPAMLRVLRGKPGADRLTVVQGDMAAGDVPPGDFDLVYLVFNTITNILTQAGQVACFRNAARHLRPGGRFLIEVFVPDLRRFPPGAQAQVFHLEDERAGLDTLDPVTQRLTSHHFSVVNGEGRVFRSHHRWAWPSELDLMAELAGLRLQDRWAGWTREPFTADSPSHVSAWVRNG